jgi:D-alanyl-D-alanine carboxypeptidase (penicillin-binding protein 5/6)
MISHLLFYLLFETLEPSYPTLMGILPEPTVVQAMASHSLSLADASLVAKSPVKKGDSIAPVIDAKSVYSVDLNTGIPLFARDIFERRPIASITKLVTAMIVLDNHKLDEEVTVSKKAATQEGSNMKLAPGEKLTVESLMSGMLINSGNDAAVALAEYDSGSEDAFVQKMNDRAFMLGLKDSHFSNAKGFDEPANYSTAYDTMIFGKAALKYPLILKLASTKTAEVASVDGKIRHHLESTNELLGDSYLNIVGLKTGSTPGAGESFVSLLKGPADHYVLTVMLSSPSRFKETKILLDWILRNFEFP